MSRHPLRLLSVALCCLLLCAGPVRAGPDKKTDERPDALQMALEAMGISAGELGYRPKAHWARYPHPKTVPYLLPFFEDLHANPLDTYGFARSFADRAEGLLSYTALTKQPTPKDRAEVLFQLGVSLGTDRLMGGFRGYSANLDAQPEDLDALYHALMTLLERSGTPLRRSGAFGGAYANEADTPEAKLRTQVARVPAVMHRELAAFILDLVDAHEWIEKGLRDVSPDMRRRVFETLPTLMESTGDGERYFPVIDDVAKRIDKASLYYGCLKALQATHDARRELSPLVTEDAEFPMGWELHVTTGWGDVHVGAQIDGVVHLEDPFLVVRCGRTASFHGPLGATTPTRSLSVALLLEVSAPITSIGGQIPVQQREDEALPAQLASGVLGCGLVYAAGGGNTHYRSRSFGQGAGLFGLGALIDEGGDDLYELRSMGQGAGYLGIGLLLDIAGDDQYALSEGDGQGLGGAGGVGVLADRRGNDHYYAEPDAKKAGRGDYHSKHAVAVSNAQGVGSGRRGDGSDGHIWAGGLGLLLDFEGDDHFEAGNFSQGLGYWYGTGILWDGAGDDTFESVYFTQGSGAHFAIGALIDEGGNDTHKLGHNAGAAFGFGWDVVNAFLIDRGSGNDRYEAKIISTGLAEVRSNAFFLDEGGDDTYVLAAKTKGFGDVDHRPRYDKIGAGTAFPFHLTQVGVFIDAGGTDRYLRRAKDGTESADPDAGDDKRWHVRARDPTKRGGPNVSCGFDLPRARFGFLDPWPLRVVVKDEPPKEK